MRGLQTSLGRASGLDAKRKTIVSVVDEQEGEMTVRPAHLNAYEFVVVSALRAQQLMAGCTPRLPGIHSASTMAQMEVAGGCITRADVEAPAGAPQRGWQL